MKGAQHQNAAKLFIEFLLSEDAAKLVSEGFEQPLRPEAAPPPGAKSLAEVKILSAELDAAHERTARREGEVERHVRHVTGWTKPTSRSICRQWFKGWGRLGKPWRRVALPEPLPPIKGIEGLRARLPRWEPAILLWLLLVAVLLFLVINPLLRLLITSFQATDTQSFTLANYGLAFGRLRNVTALMNSLLYGAAVTLVSICFAVPIAFAISRTDMPSKGFVRAVVVGAFITPSYLGAVAWILLAGPNAGWLNRAWMALTGSSSGPFDIYSFSGLVLVTALYAFPYVFVFTSDALDMVSSEMEEAAQEGGQGVLDDVKITLPLVTPAILAGRDRRVPRHHRAVRNSGHYRPPGAHQHHDAAVVAVLRVPPGSGKRLPHIRCPSSASPAFCSGCSGWSWDERVMWHSRARARGAS